MALTLPLLIYLAVLVFLLASAYRNKESIFFPFSSFLQSAFTKGRKEN